MIINIIYLYLFMITCWLNSGFFFFFRTITKVSAESPSAGISYTLNFFFRLLLHSISMPAKTPAVVRDVLDDLDSILRDAVKNGTLKEVFEKERHAIVSFRVRISDYIYFYLTFF